MLLAIMFPLHEQLLLQTICDSSLIHSKESWIIAQFLDKDPNFFRRVIASLYLIGPFPWLTG